MTMLQSQSTMCRFAVRSRSLGIYKARGGLVSSSQIRPSSSSSFNSDRSSSQLLLLSPKSFNNGRSTILGVLTSLAYTTAATTTSIALCENKKEDDNNTNNDDQNFISKIKSKLESQSFDDLTNNMQIDNETLNSILTSLGTHISTSLSSGIPTDISYGFIAGYFSGLALKKIGKVASITLGMSFLALQTLAYSGYIDVHHDKLQKQVESILDRNNDGVVDGEDVKSILEEVRKVAGFGLEEDGGNDKKLLASGGGFGMGFYGGLRSG